MSAGARPRVVALAGLAAALVLASLVRLLLAGAAARPGPDPRDWVLALCFTAIGAVVADRVRRNAVSWLLLAIGVSAAVSLFSASYAGSSVVLAWASQWAWWPAFGLTAVLLLRFPDGRLPSPRWRPAGWIAVAGLVVPTLAIALATLGEVDLLTSDVRASSAAGTRDTLLVVAQLGALLALAAAALALVALVLRFRRAAVVERQQLKWLLAAAAVALVAVVLEAVWGLPGAWLAGAVAIPVAVGVAVLRYRLYEIDLLISRTLVYGLLTALLGVVYAGGVSVLGQLLSPDGGDSQLAVAAPTLAAAALFQPARRRIQRGVDRRFNRRRHDAARLVEAFSLRLRSQLDLDTITSEVVDVARRTMEPSLVSLSLIPSPRPDGRPPAQPSLVGPR